MRQKQHGVSGMHYICKAVEANFEPYVCGHVFNSLVYGDAEERRYEDAPLSDPGCGPGSARSNWPTPAM